MKPFRIERLVKHDRKGFRCGNEELDRYLIEHARQDQRQRYSVCYLAIETGTEVIVGYYTLSSASILLKDLPERDAKKLPRYPVVPVVKIGRLAIATSHQGRGIGGGLLADAYMRIRDSGIGAFAVTVDAIDESAEKFYRHHGFTDLNQDTPGLSMLLQALK